MKTKMIYECPNMQMMTFNAQDVIANSKLAFFGEEDRLSLEEEETQEVVYTNGYNIICE